MWCPQIEQTRRFRTATGFAVQTLALRRFDARALLGLPEQWAEAMAVRHGCTWRVVERNARQFVITADLVLNRIDLTVDQGRVRAVYVG